jgi:Flp pilus assembly protein TadD
MFCIGITSALAACQGTPHAHMGVPLTAEEKIILTKADVARSLGRTEEAIAGYKTVAESSKTAVRAHLELADIYNQRKDGNAALDILQKAYVLNPSNNEVLKAYAQQLLLANRNADALNVAMEGLKHNPTDVRLLNAAGVAYDRQGEHEKAQRRYKEAMTHASAAIDNEYTTNNLALSYIATRHYDDAINLLKHHQSQASNQPALRQLMALAYGAKGEENKAYELGLIDLNVEQIKQNLEFYKQLGNGEIDPAVLFSPVP